MKSSRNKPLVSVIVPTRNSEKTLEVCLESIRKQTYKSIEIIVIDNFSSDKTLKLARKFTRKVFLHGPERSAQTNFGAKKAKGKYIYKVDSDFTLSKKVVSQCVNQIQKGFDAVVVHNSPDPAISWIAKVRKFECDMYKYDLTHSSARFVRETVFEKLGGFDEKVTAGEDYDFQNRLNRRGYKTGFIDAEAVHLGEPKSFWSHMVKYYFYGKDFHNYAKRNKSEAGEQLSFFRTVYFRHWKKFIKDPLTGIGFILYHLAKFIFGGIGFFMASSR